MPIDKRIELEIALRDSVSLTLQNISDHLEDMSSKLTRGGESISESSDVIKKIEIHTKGVGERAKETSKSLMGVGDTLKILTLGLSAIPGANLALGAAAVAGAGIKMSLDIAKKRIQLQNISTDTGLSMDQISVAMRTQARMKITEENSIKNIKTIGDQLKGLASEKRGSDLYKSLQAIDQGAFAEKLLSLVEQGRTDEAFRAYFEQMEVMKGIGTEAAHIFATKGVSLPESFLAGYTEASKGVKPAYQMNLGLALEWTREMEEMGARLRSWGNSMMGWAATAVIYLAGQEEGRHGELRRARARMVRPDITDPAARKRLGLDPLTAEELAVLKELKEVGYRYEKQIYETLQGMWDKAKSAIGRQEGGPVTSGGTYRVGERGPEMFTSGSGEYRMVGEGGPQLFKPKISGWIESAVASAYSSGLTDKIMEAEAKFRRASENTTLAQVGTGIALKKFAPGPAGLVLSGLAADEDTSWRTAVRGALGIQDPGEPLPYKPGGAWDEKAMYAESKRWAGSVDEGDVEAARSGMDAHIGGGSNGGRVRLGGDVVFNNVPPGVRTEAEGEGLDEFSMGRSSTFAGAP